MPIRKARHNHVKVFRPIGMRYANGKTCGTVLAAVIDAQRAFFQEFSSLPRDMHTIIEVVGVTGGYGASVLEVKE